MKIDTSAAKPPLKLFVREAAGADLKEVLVAHACGECRIVKGSEQEALECHGVRRCDCGAEIAENYYTACDACRAKHDAEKDSARVAAATRVPESATEHLYCDCCEKFFDDSTELFDEHRDFDRSLPTFAWATDPIHGFSIDAERIVYDALEQADINTDCEPVSAEKMALLQGFIDEWRKTALEGSYYTSSTDTLVDLAEARAAFILRWPAADDSAIDNRAHTGTLP